MPRKYKNSVRLSDGKRVGYGWYIRFVDGSGKRVKRSLGELPVKPREIGDERAWILRKRQIEKAAEEVIQMTYFLSSPLELD